MIAGTLALPVLAVVVLYVALRWRWPAWTLFVIALFPEIFAYLWSQDLRDLSTHGFLHAAIVYRLMAVGVVPDCPVLAHVPLLYPWAHHLVVGWLASAFGLAPGTGFALLNIAALAGTLYFAYRLGLYLARDRIVAIGAATFSVFGVSFMSDPFVARALHKIVPLSGFLLREPVVVKKFTNLNSNSLGFLFFSLFLYSAVRLFSERDGERSPWAYAGLGIAVVGAAIFYPITWLSIGACLIGMGLVALARRGRAAVPFLLAAAAVSGGATLLAAPYLYVIADAKQQQMYLIAPDLGFLVQKAIEVVVTFALAGVLLYWKRDALRRALSVSNDALWYLASVPATMALMYVVLGTDWSQNEYKFLINTCFAMGIIASLPMAALFRERPWIWAGVTYVFLMGFGSDIGSKVLHREYDKPDPYVMDGPWLRHADPNEDRLYRWLADHTRVDAVVLDDRLTVPTFARRALYVGLDSRGVAKNHSISDGWQIDPDIIMRKYYAYPDEVVDRRLAVAHDIYSTDGPPISESTLAMLRQDAGGSNVYVIARDSSLRDKFERDPRLSRVFETPAAAVYQLEPSGRPG